MNPIIYWQNWWRELGIIEKTVALWVLIAAVILILSTPAGAQVSDNSSNSAVWIALIAAVVSGMLSPALLLWMTNRNKRQERLEIEAREDAREARTHASLELIKKQTDGVIAQVTALAKSTGRMEGEADATKVAEGTAATLALGQQQGRDAERESIATKPKEVGDQPLPVADDRTASASERGANASEILADATKRVADAAEIKKE